MWIVSVISVIRSSRSEADSSGTMEAEDLRPAFPPPPDVLMSEALARDTIAAAGRLRTTQIDTEGGWAGQE